MISRIESDSERRAYALAGEQKAIFVAARYAFDIEKTSFDVERTRFDVEKTSVDVEKRSSGEGNHYSPHQMATHARKRTEWLLNVFISSSKHATLTSIGRRIVSALRAANSARKGQEKIRSLRGADFGL